MRSIHRIFPPDTHPGINEFAAIDAEALGGIDGSLTATNDDLTTWTLYLDVTNAYGVGAQERTIVHEFAQYLSLGGASRRKVSVGDCPVFHAGDGCPRPDSYLDVYFEVFWPDFTRSDWEGEATDAATARFDTGDFHTSYAATSPTEDFAEWVLTDQLPSDNSETTRKLLFFKNYPDLVRIRSVARTGITQ